MGRQDSGIDPQMIKKTAAELNQLAQAGIEVGVVVGGDRLPRTETQGLQARAVHLVLGGQQFYHCFGCGAHGSAIGFLMDCDHMGFLEAIESLAQEAGMEVPREASEDSGPDTRSVYEILNKSANYYQQQLRSHPQASKAVEYLKQRGLTGEIAARYGYSIRELKAINGINHKNIIRVGQVLRLPIKGKVVVAQALQKVIDLFLGKIPMVAVLVVEASDRLNELKRGILRWFDDGNNSLAAPAMKYHVEQGCD